MTTVALVRANPSAVALPMPELAPVIRHTFPCILVFNKGMVTLILERKTGALRTPAFLSNQGNHLLSVCPPRRFSSWCLEQARQTREGSQWDHIKVDQV